MFSNEIRRHFFLDNMIVVRKNPSLGNWLGTLNAQFCLCIENDNLLDAEKMDKYAKSSTLTKLLFILFTPCLNLPVFMKL